MAKESGMGDFPRKQFESVLLHSLRIMTRTENTCRCIWPGPETKGPAGAGGYGAGEHPPGAHLREMMGLLEVEMNDKPSMKPVDLCWILMEAARWPRRSRSSWISG